ncbi:hypothetical protein [Bacillus salipaludis]|uniref:Uncharacterized protein n=1 Tax=Bacillus salipaludis TaxID=2547811 RepID=A0AA90ZAN5_9BACI|nr:hypothetical protein [Bacillus salipaludis]MDQ6600851.1 hypothetical protein [Bacillus salipaludis]
MAGGLGFILISVGKIGIAVLTAIGFSNGMNWYHNHESKSKKGEGGKRNVHYQREDIRERLNNVQK